jgi:uncharacterized RDD family membrane protein YckC
MAAAAPFLASAQRRLGAAVIDAAPVLLFSIFALAALDQFKLGPAAMLVAVPLLFATYHAAFAYHWSGETPGRRFFDIRIVSGGSAVDLSIAQCIARPMVRIVWLISFVPFAAASHNPWYSVLPMLADMFLVSVLPWRQTLADFLCGTIVVRTPPPQPHRAPAAPMYSPTDAEFGVAPRHVKYGVQSSTMVRSNSRWNGRTQCARRSPQR